MTNGEILEKAVNKTVGNGLDIMKLCRLPGMEFDYVSVGDLTGSDILICYYDDHESKSLLLNVYELIFNHEFAEKLWGLEPRWGGTLTNSEMITGESVTLNNIANCDYHLMQIAMSDDPVKYLGEHLA